MARRRGVVGLVLGFPFVLAACGSTGDNATGKGASAAATIMGLWSGENRGIVFGIGDGAVATCARIDHFTISVGGNSSTCPNADICTMSESRTFYNIPLTADGSEYRFSTGDNTFTVTGVLHSTSTASGTANYAGRGLPDWKATRISTVGGRSECPPGGISPCADRTQDACIGECLAMPEQRIDPTRRCLLPPAPFACHDNLGTGGACSGDLVAFDASGGTCFLVPSGCADRPFASSTSDACSGLTSSLHSPVDIGLLPDCSSLDRQVGSCDKLRACCCSLGPAAVASCLAVANDPSATDATCYGALMTGIADLCAAAPADAGATCSATGSDGGSTGPPMTWSCDDVVGCCTNRNDPRVKQTCDSLFSDCASTSDSAKQAACSDLQQLATNLPSECPTLRTLFTGLMLCQ